MSLRSLAASKLRPSRPVFFARVGAWAPFSLFRRALASPRLAWFPSGIGDASAPIVPPASVSGRALTVVIAIMVFLACLTSGGVYMVNQSAAAWMSDVSSEVTVQVMPAAPGEMDNKVNLVTLFLNKQAGVAAVKPMTAAQSSELLEPWLGNSEALSELPIPRLIALELDRSSPPDLAAIGRALEQNFDGVTLDDHRQWQAQIRGLTRSLALGGIAILVLVAMATIAVIVSATRSAMASNREIIEVLNFVGATNRFIAREFERHFLTLGIRAGLAGAVAASVVFLLMPLITALLSGNVVTNAEIRRLVGTAALDPAGYLLFALVVVVVALLAMITTRLGVFRVLRERR